jgi:thiamine-phosphate pyrophosphorylase
LARSMLGVDRIIGGSASTMEEALKCVSEGADYVGFGPVYPTGSKEDAGPVSGISALRQVVRKAEIPVVAIGGITRANIREVLDAGAWGIAVISAVCCVEKPDAATKALHEAFAGQMERI